MSMSSGNQEQLTHLFDLAVEGDQDAIRSIWESLHSDIRMIASMKMAGESNKSSLQATLLINEAYLKLFGGNLPAWNDRRHFLNSVRVAMERYLKDHARRRNAIKRGGEVKHVSLTIAAGELQQYDTACSEEGIRALAAINRLQEHAPESAEIARLKLINNLKIREIADLMELSPTSVKKKWAYAVACLRKELGINTRADGNADAQ